MKQEMPREHDVSTSAFGRAMAATTVILLQPLLAAVICSGGAEAVRAADFKKSARETLALPPADIHQWPGFHLGANAGYGVARDPNQSLFASGAANLNTTESFNLSPIGMLGGAQIGFDWQATPDWVWGIETDIQASAQADATTCSKSCLVQSFTQVSQKLPWFGTLRGRVGWSNGPALLYVTGGWAYGQVATDYAVNVAASGIDARSFRHTKSGWVVGAGIEAHVTGSWTAKMEYLYLDLGTVSDVFAYAAAPGLGTQTERSHIHDHVARLGLNYRWADPARAAIRPATGIYKVRPAAAGPSWSGFYLGANVGYGVARDPGRSILTQPGLTAPDTFNLSPRGVLGGVQLGYSWNIAPTWVLGVEADLQASAQSDSTTCVTSCLATPFTTVFSRASQELPWLGTVRGRVGWSSGSTLYYVTGGWAYGRVTTAYSVDLNQGVDFRSFSHDRTGWVVGGGLETQLAGGWTVKAEYLYVDLGTVTDAFVYAFDPTARYDESSAIRNHIARLGLNYRWGDPVIARY